MIVVLDTNVVVSGILTPGGPAGRVVDLWAEGAFTVAVSPALIEEYIGVLLRPEFRGIGSAGKRTRIVASFLDLANTVTVLPQTPLNVVAGDPADNRVLECAAAAKAAYVVSGDRHLLDLGMFGTTPILSPAGFLEKLPKNI
ncbi:MAG: putative toxin-antitoxin system toxin component, PIN family [Bacillota bacterium]|nr:putative toxin-antitoxin system toxin component, PIN family [Bacillota bacterium]